MTKSSNSKGSSASRSKSQTKKSNSLAKRLSNRSTSQIPNTQCSSIASRLTQETDLLNTPRTSRDECIERDINGSENVINSQEKSDISTDEESVNTTGFKINKYFEFNQITRKYLCKICGDKVIFLIQI